jgi:hypothetical protein
MFLGYSVQRYKKAEKGKFCRDYREFNEFREFKDYFY